MSPRGVTRVKCHRQLLASPRPGRDCPAGAPSPDAASPNATGDMGGPEGLSQASPRRGEARRSATPPLHLPSRWRCPGAQAAPARGAGGGRAPGSPRPDERGLLSSLLRLRSQPGETRSLPLPLRLARLAWQEGPGGRAPRDGETAPGRMETETAPANHSSTLAGTGKSWEGPEAAAPRLGRSAEQERAGAQPCQPGSASSSPRSLSPPAALGPAAASPHPGGCHGASPRASETPRAGLSPATGASLQMRRKRRNNDNHHHEERAPLPRCCRPKLPLARQSLPGPAACPPVLRTRWHPLPKAPCCSSQPEPPSLPRSSGSIPDTGGLAGAGAGAAAAFSLAPSAPAGHSPTGETAGGQGTAARGLAGHSVPTATPW